MHQSNQLMRNPLAAHPAHDDGMMPEIEIDGEDSDGMSYGFLNNDVEDNE